MDSRLIVGEFQRLFTAKMQEKMELERGMRSGRIDSARANRVMSGSMRVFEQPRFNDRENVVAGSLAIVCSSIDLFFYGVYRKKQQSVMWAESMQALVASAIACKIPFRIFSAHGSDLTKANSPAVHYEWDNLEEMLEAAGNGRQDWNSWTRQKESVEAAERWHSEKRAGTKLTLLCTMVPESRGAEINGDAQLYRLFLEQTGTETTRWTRYTKFYALGIKLADTAKNTWGEQAKYGLDNHFKDCFPSATRYQINEEADLLSTIRDLGKRMAQAI